MLESQLHEAGGAQRLAAAGVDDRERDLAALRGGLQCSAHPAVQVLTGGGHVLRQPREHLLLTSSLGQTPLVRERERLDQDQLPGESRDQVGELRRKSLGARSWIDHGLTIWPKLLAALCLPARHPFSEDHLDGALEGSAEGARRFGESKRN